MSAPGMPSVLNQTSPNEFTMDDVSGDGVWITVGNINVHLHKTDEGVVCDMYPLDREGECIASTYAFDSEGSEE